MKVLMMVMNTFENDSRVHRTAKTLAEQGMEVALVCLHKDGLPEFENSQGYQVYRRSIPGPLTDGEDILQSRIGKLKNSNFLVFTLVKVAYGIYKAVKISYRHLKRFVVAFLSGLLNVLKIVFTIFAALFHFISRGISFSFLLTKRLALKSLWKVLSFVRRIKNKAHSLHRKLKNVCVRTMDRVFPNLSADLAFELRRKRYLAFAEEAKKFASSFNPDVIHAHDFNCLIAAKSIAEDTHVPYIYDSHELWVERNRMARVSPSEKLWETETEARLMRDAAFSITVCDSIADHLADSYHVKRPYVVRNTPDRKVLIRDPSKDLRNSYGFSKNEFLTVYLGILAHNRGLVDILKALPHTDPSVKFIAMGPMNPAFRDTFEDLIASLNLENRAFYHEPVPGKEVSSWIANCDLSLTTMNRSCLSYVYTLPNKLFESIQAELPVVGPDSPEIIRIIEKYKCGATYKDGDHLDLASQIEKLRTNRDLLERYKRGAQQASAELCWENEKSRLISSYLESLSLKKNSVNS